MKKIILAAIALAALVGCAAKPPQYHGVTFLEPARDISSAFITPTGDIFIVPEKGVLVEGVSRLDGHPLAWHIQGSYLVLPFQSTFAVNAVNLRIGGKSRTQSLRNFTGHAVNR